MEITKQWTSNISEYDSDSFGPLLGVSDEGSAAKIIASVAVTSAKMTAFKDFDIKKVGIIIDGERMTSAGECPVGPEEYNEIVKAAKEKTNCSTNVGVRLNARYYQMHPEILLSDYQKDKEKFLQKILEIFKPYIETPNGEIRPLKLRISIDLDNPQSLLSTLLTDIKKQRDNGKIGNEAIHRIAILVQIEDVISKEKHLELLSGFISLANNVGVKELAIEGHIIEYGKRRLSSNGLLNIIEPSLLAELIDKAKSKHVNLRYKYCIDIESAARTVWTGLHTARTHGLNAGKYGLVPLIMEEQREVIETIQKWMSDWTAIPAFYVDTPLLSNEELYFETTIKEGLLKWIEMIAGIGVNTALIDCPDRIVRRRLLKTSSTDTVGVLSMEDVSEIMDFAKKQKVRLLWSGGITYSQAYEFGKRKVFGIFTTSTTAKKVAVGNVLIEDPVLPFEMEPTEKGIKLVHSLLQGGFLVSSLKKELADEIDALSIEILRLITPNGLDSISDELLNGYIQKLVLGWSETIKNNL